MRAIALLICFLCVPAQVIAEGQRAHGPLPQAVYVWQRQWTGRLSERVRQGGFAGHAVLVAEVEDGRVVGVEPDWAALRDRTVTVVVRVHRLADLPLARAPILGALERARRHGLADPAVQLDLDASRGQLASFAAWLRALRPALAGASLSITGLVSWLPDADLPDLLSSVDHWVLQLHGLHRDGDHWVIYDDAAARLAISRAARLGRPFVIALPTFGLTVGERDGRVIGVVAEESPPAWPPDSRITRVEVPPAPLARLLADLEREHPALLVGVIWFRLPVPGDRHNWSWATLQAVMAGRLPEAEPAALHLADDGALELAVGEGLAARQLTVAWPDGQPLLAFDAHDGWQASLDAAGHLTFTATTARPGRQVGWLRLQEPEHAYIVR